MDVYIKDEKLLRLKCIINTVFGPETISNDTTCHMQFGLLVNTINTQPRIQHVNRGSYQGHKVSEHGTDHSYPSRSDVKNLCS